MDLFNCAEQILNLYNYYNGAIIVDRQGRVEYYHNNRKDINTLSEKTMLKRSILEIYPSINVQTSTLFEVMRTGRPILNTYQSLKNYKGEEYGAICTTYPIFDGSKIIGAVEAFWYLEDREKYLSIFIDESVRTRPGLQKGIADIVSTSAVMAELKRKIAKVARTNSTCLIYGETGTGKELVARAIHFDGTRQNRPFVSQNCAAIPENLLESILFGTVKGAFTGAEDRKGLFEAANGGTLFLDEINSMDKVVQAKILRAIEEKKIYRVGGTKEIPVNIRIIAATNVTPERCVEEGKLREDLFYRLSVVQLNIPPLRARKVDIRALTDHCVQFYNQTMQKHIRGVLPEVMEVFNRYSWPGNVRELRNTIESGFNLCEGEWIGLEDLNLSLLQTPARSGGRQESAEGGEDGKAAGTLKARVQRFEQHIITEAVQACGSLSAAAAQLGITRQTLSKKLKEVQQEA